MGILNSVTIGGSGSTTIKIANVATSTSDGKVAFSVENNPTWWGMSAVSMPISTRPASGSFFFVVGSSNAPCGYKSSSYRLSTITNRPSKSYNASTHTVTFTQYSTTYQIPTDTDYMLFYI